MQEDYKRRWLKALEYYSECDSLTAPKFKYRTLNGFTAIGVLVDINLHNGYEWVVSKEGVWTAEPRVSWKHLGFTVKADTDLFIKKLNYSFETIVPWIKENL